MASAGAFLKPPKWRRRKKPGWREQESPSVTAIVTGESHLAKVTAKSTRHDARLPDVVMLRNGAVHANAHRPRSRGHTINGSENEFAFQRARATLRLLNNDTPPVLTRDKHLDATHTQIKAQHESSHNYRRRRRKHLARPLPLPNRRGRQKRGGRNGQDLKGMISELWSLQVNKPKWLMDNIDKETKVPVEKERAPSTHRLAEDDLSLQPPNPLNDPLVLRKVHKALRLHPSASHIEKSLLGLHSQNALGDSANGNTKITSWITHKYPLLVQRDAFRENRAITTIARAFRAHRSRCAFRSMVRLQRTRVAAATCIQHSWCLRQLRISRFAEAGRVAPLVVRFALKEAVESVISHAIHKQEQNRLKLLRQSQRERDRIRAEEAERSDRERECRQVAASKIQLQWVAYSWRKRHNIFFSLRQIQHCASKRIQDFIRAKMRRIELKRAKNAKSIAEAQYKMKLHIAAAKIQRLVLRARGRKWRGRMRFGLDVRDLLGADDDLSFDSKEITSKVRDFLTDKDFGNPEIMEITGTGRKYYTGGVFSQLGSRAPGRELTPGQRSVRLRQARMELASIAHSVGKLDRSENTWKLAIEDLLEVEWQKEQLHRSNIQKMKEKLLPESNEETNQQQKPNSNTGAVMLQESATASAVLAPEVNVDEESLLPRGSHLFAKLLSPPQKYAELGSGKRLSGLMVTLLTHLMLVFQCQGRFEIADRLLHHDLLGKEYKMMMKKVQMADAFRSRNLMYHTFEHWKKSAAEFYWKRQHALKKYGEVMQSTRRRLFIKWANWARATLYWRRSQMDKMWSLWRMWMRDRRKMLRLLGESDEHNVISMKRRVVRRWYFQIREWRRQRKLIHESFSHGRIVMLQTRLNQWKQWKRNIGHPWWIAQKHLQGQFFYWERVVREHFNWIRRIIFLENDDYVAWATVSIQKRIRGKWGRRRAYKLKRMLALHRYRKVELAENMVIWNAAAKVIQAWYKGFLTQRRLGLISIQLREQAEDRRLRLRKLRLQIKYLKMRVQSVGVEPKELKDRVEDARRCKERSEKVVRSASLQLRKGKKMMQKVIIQYGEAKIKMKCDDMENELRLEGAASKLTEEEIEKSIKRNHQFVVHEGLVAREKAYGSYMRRVKWQEFSKRELERMTDNYDFFKAQLEEYDEMDEEGQVRRKIEILSKFLEDSAASRIVALLRGNHDRLRVATMIDFRRQTRLLREWGALKAQTIWRRHKAKKVAALARERKEFLKKNRRVIAIAKATGLPLGVFEQEKVTVANLAKGGITEKNLEKIESKMKFFTNPPWKRRMSEKRWKSLPKFVQQRIPPKYRPPLPEKIQARRVLTSFFKDMHTYIKDFSALHCPWRETPVYTVIKMKVALKLVNARCRFREDGGIKRYSLHDLLKCVLERGGSLVPIGKPTYFPKMPSLSPQTWGIWQIPMEHPSEEFGNLPRANEALQEMWRPSTAEEIAMALADSEVSDEEELDIDKLYTDALNGDNITEGKDHGLTGLIGGDVLGLTSDGMSVASYQSASTSGYSNVFKELDNHDDEILSEEEEYPDIEMPLPIKAIEAEKLETKALSLLEAVRHTDPKKKRRRMRRVFKRRQKRMRESKHDNISVVENEEDEDDTMRLRPTDKDGIDLFDDSMSDISLPLSASDVGDEDDELDRMDVADMDMEQLAAYERKKIEKIRKEQEEEEARSSGKLSVFALPDCLACKVRNNVTRTAQRLCHDCNLPYCVSCYRLSHKSGRPRLHHFTKYEFRVDQFHEEDTKKKAHYETAYLQFLARTNPNQYRRQLSIAEFEWSDNLMRRAAQIFIDIDWKDSGEIDMSNVLNLLRELFKKRRDEVPLMRTALRHAWMYLDNPTAIDFAELMHTVPVYMRFFRHQSQVHLQAIEKEGGGNGLDLSIFV